MKVAWVLGWAVPESWFAVLASEALPEAEHRYFAADSQLWTKLEAAGPFDHLVGYSLGSLLLLSAPERANRCGRVSLLAPIFAFAAEERLGGRASRTQVRHLARWLRREPLVALADFYARARLDVSSAQAPVEKVDELLWGLERLADDRVAPPMPATWSAWVGQQDPLLDAALLHVLDPEITVLERATHHPAALIAAWKETIE
jgi:hypothetical protein